MYKHYFAFIVSIFLFFANVAYADDDEAVTMLKGVINEMTSELDENLPAIKKDHNTIDNAAVTMLKGVIDQMTSELDKNLPAIKKDPNTIVAIVDKVIVPHVDFSIMSKGVLGRHWKTATQAQRDNFQNVFSRWVILTYSSAFLHYNGQKVEFGKVRPIGTDGSREEIFTNIVQNSGQKIPVNYRMIKNAKGEWKAYDMNVENVSLVTSFRTQIDSEINRKGIDQVIKDLEARNKKGLVATK